MPAAPEGGSGGGSGGDATNGAPGQGEQGGSGYIASGGGGGGGDSGGSGGNQTVSAGGGGGGYNWATPAATYIDVDPVGTGTPQVTISWFDTEAPVIAPHEDLTVAAEDGARS